MERVAEGRMEIILETKSLMRYLNFIKSFDLRKEKIQLIFLLEKCSMIRNQSLYIYIQFWEIFIDWNNRLILLLKFI